jgi:hypothetical protein
MTAAFRAALQAAFPALEVEPVVAATNNPKFGDYQCNNAMQLFGRLKGKARGAKPSQRGLAITQTDNATSPRRRARRSGRRTWRRPSSRRCRRRAA